jgi:hypothetical protein
MAANSRNEFLMGEQVLPRDILECARISSRPNPALFLGDYVRNLLIVLPFCKKLNLIRLMDFKENLVVISGEFHC